MAVGKLGDSTQLDADLTSVANAIRTKGGTSASLAFPADFLTAIAAIPSGGGDPNENLAKLLQNTLTTVNCDATSLYNGIRNTTGVKHVFLPQCTFVTTDACYNATGLIDIVLPRVTSFGTRIFYGCTALVACDEYAANITGTLFQNCSKFNTLIIRKTSSIATLANISVFSNTPFASGKSGGTLYVPSALISSYQAATNWSTILGYTNNNILPIEGSIYETQYADGTPIT